MRDFDQQQREEQEARAREFEDKTFTFRGETFYVNPNPGFHRAKVLALADWTGAMSLSLLEESLLNLISDRDHGHTRFSAVVAGDTAVYMQEPGEDEEPVDVLLWEPNDAWFPVTTQNLLELHNWLVGEVAERPPTPPERSSNGSQGTGEQSRGTSSSEPAAASTG